MARRPRSARRLVPALLVGALTLTACSGGSGDGDAAGRTEAPADASASAAPSVSDAATEEPEPIMLGDHPYRSPCRLVDLDTVETAFGPLGRQGNVVQVSYADSLEGRRWRQATDTITESVEAECTYSWRDRAAHDLRVKLAFYDSPRRAKEEWAAIAYLGTGEESRKLAQEDLRSDFLGEGSDWSWVLELARENEANSGGKRVRGAKHLLYVPGEQRWVTWRDNALVWLQWTKAADGFSDEPLSPAEYRFQAPRMKRLARAARTADATDQRPLPVQLGNPDTFEGTAYVEPCALLDGDVVRLLLGRRPEPDVRATSVERDVGLRMRRGGDEPFYRSPSASCERTARISRGIRERTANAELEVRYAASAQEATRLVERYMVERFYDPPESNRITLAHLVSGRLATPRASDADVLYIFDTGDRVSYLRVVHAYAAVGPYVIGLDADRGLVGRSLRSKQLTADQYAAAVDALAARVRELTDECGGECPAPS